MYLSVPIKSHIIQNAVKHYSDIYLVSKAINDSIQYEDLKGNVLRISGGYDYLNRSDKFPGVGCEDYTLTTETPIKEVFDKLLATESTLVKDLAVEEIEKIIKNSSNLINPIVQDCLTYWHEKKKGEINDIP